MDYRKLMNYNLRNTLRPLRSEPFPDKLFEVMQLPQFELIVEQVLTFEEGTDGKLTVNYLKDVSLLLSLVPAVRGWNIEQHLLAERKTIYLAFAYDYQNHERYNTYQNVYQSCLKQIDHPAFHNLKTKGICRKLERNFLQYMAIYLQNCSTKRLKILLVRFVLDSVQTLMQ